MTSKATDTLFRIYDDQWETTCHLAQVRGIVADYLESFDFDQDAVEFARGFSVHSKQDAIALVSEVNRRCELGSNSLVICEAR